MFDQQLFIKYKENPSIELRNQLVEQNYYIAETLSKKFVNRGVDYDDLLQVASFALIKAVERFNVDAGNKFTTFATPTIIGELKKYFRDKAYTIRVPRRYYEAYPSVKKAMEELSNRLGKTPTAKDLASETGYTEEEVLEILESSRSYNTLSINEELDDDGFTRNDVLGNEEKGYIDIENKDLYKKALDNLNTMEKQLVIYRYEKNLSQKEVALKLGVSQMYVSRLERKIYQRLKVVLSEE